MMPDEVNVYLWRDGFHLFFPMRGKDHWRVVGILPDELREARRRIRGGDPVVAGRRAPGRSSSPAPGFRPIASIIAPPRAFATGRCFLLGDAAHIHSPSVPRA